MSLKNNSEKVDLFSWTIPNQMTNKKIEKILLDSSATEDFKESFEKMDSYVTFDFSIPKSKPENSSKSKPSRTQIFRDIYNDCTH